MEQRDEDNAGGFFPEGHEEEEPDSHRSTGFFPVAHGDDDDNDDAGGGFIVEGHDEEPAKPTISQEYATPQSLLSNGKPAADQKSEYEELEDEEMEDINPEHLKSAADLPRNPQHLNLFQKLFARPKLPQSKKTPTSLRSTGKRKRLIEDSEDEGENEISSLSSLEPASENETPQKPSPQKGVRKAMSAKTPAIPRKTPKRNAARKSQTALKSHYFEHDEDEEDDE
ncbi:hypothetical protein LSUB1_G004286 [Lachnellula subtilissima]|uniref:Uncharacterized protein n=1 Tax=Lachnellula subtilissima TaxID=602034 RepID=A0A8H8RNI7_9HELO|nr:hypothetical protein LSUB1_G004286 [Lachnellula subtilissima]